MSTLDELTKEVASSTLSDTKVTDVVSMDDVINTLLSTFKYKEVEAFNYGVAKQGHNPPTSATVLRSLLYREIEQMELTKAADNTDRTITSKTKKALLLQVDTILSILELSISSEDNRHFVLGMLLRSMR
tara:strand:+ start:445 stop:834 length:390 start_codon:yes stop_codon:yes gene_type:complete